MLHVTIYCSVPQQDPWSSLARALTGLREPCDEIWIQETLSPSLTSQNLMFTIPAVTIIIVD